MSKTKAVLIDFDGFDSDEDLLDFVSKLMSEANWKKGQTAHVQYLSEYGKEVIDMAIENLE